MAVNEVNTSAWCPYCNAVNDISCVYCPSCGGHLGGNQVEGARRGAYQDTNLQPYGQQNVAPYTGRQHYQPAATNLPLQLYPTQGASAYPYATQGGQVQPYPQQYAPAPQAQPAPYPGQQMSAPYPAPAYLAPGMAAPGYMPQPQQVMPMVAGTPQVTILNIPGSAPAPAAGPAVVVVNNDHRDHGALALFGSVFGFVFGSVLLSMVIIAILAAIAATH